MVTRRSLMGAEPRACRRSLTASVPVTEASCSQAMWSATARWNDSNWQERQARELARFENVRLPDDIDYTAIRGLSAEVVEKLTATRPRSLGQASRISGVTPVAVSTLMTHLNLARKRRPKHHDSPPT